MTNLFDYAVQQTSIDAFRSIEPVIPPMDARVLSHISADGKTCWEIEEEADLAHQTASSCLRRLAQRFEIIDSGDRRQTASGRWAIVWKVCSAEEKAARRAIMPKRKPTYAELVEENQQLRLRVSQLERDLSEAI